MIIISEDGKRTIDVGSSDIWYSVFSTIDVRLASLKKKIPLAMQFMEAGTCTPEAAYETARQFNLARDGLAGIVPDKCVYDKNDKKKDAPWKGNLSPVITSCANLYTTADGKDLLFEVVSILTYAAIVGVSVSIC